MQNDKNEDYGVSLWSKVVMWMSLRKMIKTTKRSIRHAHLTMKLYQHLALQFSGDDEVSKKKRSEIELKYGQMEASAMAEENYLRILQNINLNDADLYSNVRD